MFKWISYPTYSVVMNEACQLMICVYAMRSITLYMIYKCFMAIHYKVCGYGYHRVFTQYTWWHHQWKHFPRHWPFVREIHQSPVNSLHKGQWCEALMYSLICAWSHIWANNGDPGDLRCHGAHYDVILMKHFHWWNSYNSKYISFIPIICHQWWQRCQYNNSLFSVTDYGFPLKWWITSILLNWYTFSLLYHPALWNATVLWWHHRWR